MFKLIKTIFSAGLLILLFLWFRKESLLENWLSDRLGYQVSIGKVSMRKYGIKIRHLCLHNPSRFNHDYSHALETDFITARISIPKLIFARRLEITLLDIQGPLFNLILSDKNDYESNWSQFFKKPYRENSFGFDVMIKNCLFRGVRFKIFKPNGKELPLISLPFLECHSKNISAAVPSFLQSVSSLIYLTFESGLSKVNLKPQYSGRLAKQAHFL
ncbi:MAG: hypothetical protein RR733_04635, partial [Victivallaceae bacterium]